jgi:hypothetical protein
VFDWGSFCKRILFDRDQRHEGLVLRSKAMRLELASREIDDGKSEIAMKTRVRV